jgi:hypothetical protein
MIIPSELYMKRITLGRENVLREMTVDLAQVKPHVHTHDPLTHGHPHDPDLHHRHLHN